jgi:hypothetical protein
MTAPTKAARSEDPSRGVLPADRWPDEVRIESYFFYGDEGTRGGRPVATHKITRCIECGEQSIKQIGA